MKVVLKSLTASAVVSLGVIGPAATASFGVASQVTFGPGTSVPSIPFPLPPLQSGKGVSIDLNCSSPLVTALGNGALLSFTDGNAHQYGPASHPLTNGFNVEGDATLLLIDPTSGATFTYVGDGHAWFGQNNVPPPSGTIDPPPTGPGAQVMAETVQFHGTATTTDSAVGSIDLQGSGGQTLSASGNMSGWGHAKVTC